jgi:uncharacterized protein YndB with AHSA1/START domain
MSDQIVIEVVIDRPVSSVWVAWTQPEHIVQWNFASDEWACPQAENDLRNGGSFSYRMAAKDGSVSFDFGGVHSKVIEHQQIESTLGDGRLMRVSFEELSGGKTRLVEAFEPEGTNPLELQRMGWSAILENFRKHAETVAAV